MKTLSKTLKSRYRGLSPVPMPTSADTIRSYSCPCTCRCNNGDTTGSATNAATDAAGESANN
jgi:hypothetical protein